MEFKELFEMITLDVVLEGIGMVFGFGLLWKLFLGGGINSLMELFIAAVC